jgi:sulfate adenylyltransferase
MAALVSRAPHQTGRVGAAGLTRSLLAASRALAPRLPNVDIQTIVIPWPLREGDGAPDRRAEALHLLRAYGATETLFGGEQQQLSDADLAAVLPEASLQEVQRARSTKWSRPAIILFTGLSGSGKSTIARGLAETLRDEGATEVVLLDGDEMRRRISADLGFDRASRNANVERIAHAAAEIAKGGGIAIAAPIAPFREGRARAREIATAVAPYILVHVSTPLEVCESRDRKGLYAKARAGEVKEFTGISSPYEAPDDADLVIDASRVTIKAAVEQVKALIRS